jgi:hypothetical protein
MEMAEKLMSGELIVVVAKNPEPPKPKLSPDEQALADSLVSIASKYGKFNEDETGIWAGYEKAKDNVVAHIGVKCSNCALYEGNGVCKIIAQQVEDGGKCRFAVIPDGVVKGVYSPNNEKPGPRKKKAVKYKALGASIGGGGASADDMIDRDGDGMIFDGTPDEQPVKRKPKKDYERMDNSFLEKRRRKFVSSELNRQGVTPGGQGNRTDEEIVAREDARSAFTVEEDRKRFVRNQLRKRGMTPTAAMADRSDDERQARREARAEYDRRMRAGEPVRETTEETTTTPPAENKPDTSWEDNEQRRMERLRPDTSFQDNENSRFERLRPQGYTQPPTRQEPQEEWDGIVRGRGMQYVASRYPNRPGGANSDAARDPKWIAEQLQRQRESRAAVEGRNENARRRDDQRAANNADRRDLDARTRDFYARGGGRDGNMRNQTAASPISRARSGGESDREGRLNRDSSGRVTGVDRNRPTPVNPRGPGGGNLIVGEDGRGRSVARPRTAPTPIEPNRPGKDKPDPADRRDPGTIQIGRYPRDPNRSGQPGNSIEIGRYPRDPNKPRRPGRAIPRTDGFEGR